jgi:RND family efflux transporter MFP subunit
VDYRNSSYEFARTGADTMTRRPHPRIVDLRTALLLAAISFQLASCVRTSAGTAVTSAPEVEVITVEQRNIPIYREWIGTLDGMMNAAIRSQVTGYLLTQDYSEGSFVRKGQLLFTIDPRPLQAAVDQARGQLAQAHGQLAQAQAQFQQSEAQLASAEANQRKTQFDENRYIPLARENAVTQQDLDNAVQNNLSAKAQVKLATAQVEAAKAQIQGASATVEAATASLEAAQVNLGFTKLYSPIDGIAGNAQIQIGNLVNPAATAVTTVSTLDPIKITFAVSEQEYLRFTRQHKPSDPVAPFTLILADGAIYPHEGTFAFTGRQVNPSTGAIEVTGIFANPGNILRPGQYGKVRVAVETLHGALTVPLRAVSEMQGSYEIAAVDAKDAVSVHTVEVGDQIGSSWIIRDGLKAGERVIVDGVQKVASGMHVHPIPSRQKS